MSSRLAKELAGLSPWGWDSRVEVHPPGPASKRDFSEVDKLALKDLARTAPPPPAPTPAQTDASVPSKRKYGGAQTSANASAAKKAVAVATAADGGRRSPRKAIGDAADGVKAKRIRVQYTKLDDVFTSQRDGKASRDKDRGRNKRVRDVRTPSREVRDRTPSAPKSKAKAAARAEGRAMSEPLPRLRSPQAPPQVTKAPSSIAAVTPGRVGPRSARRAKPSTPSPPPKPVSSPSPAQAPAPEAPEAASGWLFESKKHRAVRLLRLEAQREAAFFGTRLCESAALAAAFFGAEGAGGRTRGEGAATAAKAVGARASTGKVPKAKAKQGVASPLANACAAIKALDKGAGWFWGPKQQAQS